MKVEKVESLNGWWKLKVWCWTVDELKIWCWTVGELKVSPGLKDWWKLKACFVENLVIFQYLSEFKFF